MADEEINNNNENPGYSFKLATEESANKGNTNRNENSGLNSKRGKKKKLIKVKTDDGLRNKSAINQKVVDVKTGEPKVNNIIIHINNQINTMHTSQNIQVNTANNIKDLDIIRNNEKINRPYQSPNGFVELKIDNNEVNFKYNNSVIEASQNKLFVNISRLLFSKKCDISYTVSIVMSILITLLAFVDIFVRVNFMNTVWLFVIEMVIIAVIAFDVTCRIYVIKTEYFSNILLIGLDILLTVFTPVQIIRFATQAVTNMAHILHVLFALSMVLRFIVVLIDLRRTIKRQEDVRQNVEEIINFSEMMEENPKNFDAISNKNVKKLTKVTPAISFVEDDGLKNNKKGLNLIKEEKKEQDMIDEDQANI